MYLLKCSYLFKYFISCFNYLKRWLKMTSKTAYMCMFMWLESKFVYLTFFKTKFYQHHIIFTYICVWKYTLVIIVMLVQLRSQLFLLIYFLDWKNNFWKFVENVMQTFCRWSDEILLRHFFCIISPPTTVKL